MRIRVGIASLVAIVGVAFTAAPAMALPPPSAACVNGGENVELRTPNVTVNVTRDGCYFLFVANNVTLNLNGHVADIDVDHYTGGPTPDLITVKNGEIGGLYAPSTQLNLDRVTVSDNPVDWAGAVETGGNVITNSRFVNNRLAIDLYWGSSTRITNTVFEGNQTAIVNTGDSDTVIRNDVFSHNGTAIYASPEDEFGVVNQTISDNRFADNGSAISAGAGIAGDTDHLRIQRNWFVRNTGAAVDLRLACDDVDCGFIGSLVSDNVAVHNGVGIRVRGYDTSFNPAPLVALKQITLARNTVIGGGIDAAGVTDGRGNRVTGGPCIGVVCR